MNGEVVDPGLGDLPGVAGEVRDARARHVEADHLGLDGLHHTVGVELQGGGDRVPVEEVVEVLVRGHPLHDLVARLVEQLARVAVRDPGGQFLEADVDEGLEHRRGFGHLGPGHLGHPPPLEGHRVNGPGDRQVVTNNDRVPALFRRPAPVPLPPRTAREDGIDVGEVVGQIVLGQQVDEQRTPRRRRPRLTLGGWRPLPAGLEVPPQRPRDKLVGEPLLGGRKVAFEQLASHRFKLGHKGDVIHASSLPTGR